MFLLKIHESGTRFKLEPLRGYVSHEEQQAAEEIFGRMHWEQYRAPIYDFQALLNMWKSVEVDTTAGTKVHEKRDVVVEEVDPGDAFAEIIKEQMAITGAKLKEKLARKLNAAVSDFELNIDMTTIDEVGRAVEMFAREKAKGIKCARKRTIVEEVPYEISHVRLKFGNGLVVEAEGRDADALKLLLPTCARIKEKVEQIKRWRTDGVAADERTYEVRGERQPFDHQWTMWKIHTYLDKSANLSQMGTGKTFGVLMSIDTRIQRGEVERGNILVVCPATLLENWQREIEINVPHLSCGIVQGTFTERMEMFLNDENRPDILLTNYETFAMSKTVKNAAGEEKELPMSKLVGTWDWDMVILDECHKIKNPTAIRTGNIIRAFANVPYTIIMSGTISANKMHDLHLPFVFLNHARQFNSAIADYNGGLKNFSELHAEFVNEYFWRDGYKTIPKHFTTHELRSKMEEISVRFEKTECFTLPEKVYELHMVDMHPKQKQLYELLQAKLAQDLTDTVEAGGTVTVVNVLAMMMKLAEAANGWIYDDEHNLVEFPWNPKLDALVEDLEGLDDGDKVVIWSRFTQDLHAIAARLEKIYGEEAVAVIHGGESCSICSSRKSERFEITQMFNDLQNPLRFVVANSAVGSHGINLTGATYEKFYSNSFVKTDRIQAEDRCHRFGMRNSLTISDFVMRGTIDEAVLGALKSYKGMLTALLEYIGIDPSRVGVDATKQEDAVIVVEHQRQGSKECVLATVAMLSGEDLIDVREMGKKVRGGREWSEADRTIGETAMLMQVYLPALAEKYREFHANGGRLLQTEERIPMVGMGAISVRWSDGRKGHIVAFQNGVVFDSGMERPMDAQTWQNEILTRGGYVEKVFTI